MSRKREYKIAVIAGDGIGPEVVSQGIRVLEAVSRAHSISLSFTRLPWGAGHYLETGVVLPQNAFEILRDHDAVYLGAIGDPRVPAGILERGILLEIRKKLDLYANLRPMKLYHPDHSPLKNSEANPFDVLVVRENTEDLYFGPSRILKKGTPEETGLAVAFYTRKGIERIVRYAFQLARNRRKKLTLCDKANAIRVHGMWREVFSEVGRGFPDVEQEFIYVDACAMAFVQRPHTFDVVVTTNLFGDILTDLGSELCGGIGLAPSANLHPDPSGVPLAGTGEYGLFEPIHGSAPGLAGKNEANPIGAILAGAMMLDYLGEKEAARTVEQAVERVFRSSESRLAGTKEIAEAVLCFCPGGEHAIR